MMCFVADNDPHFLLWVEGSETPVCFDLMGQPGDSYQLIADPAISKLNYHINWVKVNVCLMIIWAL